MKDLKGGTETDVYKPVFIGSSMSHTGQEAGQPGVHHKGADNRTGSIQTTEYYSALKRSKAPTQATTSVSPEDLIKGKKADANDSCYTGNLERSNASGGRKVVVRAGVGGTRRYSLMGPEFQFGMTKGCGPP